MQAISFPGFIPVKRGDGTVSYVRSDTKFSVPDGTEFFQLVPVNLAPKQVAHTIPKEGEMTAEEEAAYEEFEKQLNEANEADAWIHDEVEKDAMVLQKVATRVKKDDTEKEKIMEIFVDANRKFQIQKSLFKNGNPRAELHAAQVEYIATVDALRAAMDKYNIDRYPALSLKDLADERWGDEDHGNSSDFDKKIKIIYDSIKSKIAHYNPSWKKNMSAAEKRAPIASTLADAVSLQLAKETGWTTA